MSDIPKKTSSRLGEILKGLTGGFQNTSPSQFSVPKQYALQLLDKFDLLATKHTKQGWTKQIWNALKFWVRTKIIPTKTDEEVKQDLYEIYLVLEPMFNKIDRANQLKNTQTDKVIHDKVMKLPDYKELAKLL